MFTNVLNKVRISEDSTWNQSVDRPNNSKDLQESQDKDDIAFKDSEKSNFLVKICL